MNVTNLPREIPTTRRALSRMKDLLLWKKGLAIRVLVAALLLSPLVLTGNVSAFLLNTLLLAVMGLLIWRLASALREGRRQR